MPNETVSEMTEQFKSWREDLTELEQCRETYWDMYKDAYGVRPRGIDTSTWTVEMFEAEFAHLDKVLAKNSADQAESERIAVIDFEARVGALIDGGAGNRETALRWIDQADGSNGDMEYLCFLNGLPYRYFKQK